MNFVNLTNHSSMFWDKAQREAAQKYGEIIDLPFPEVPTTATEADIEQMAADCCKKIESFSPRAVLCQGEFTLAFRIVSLLLAREITVLAACSQRDVAEKTLPDGRTEKSAVFKFVKFRRYQV